MVKDLCDSRRKKEFITGCYIPIDIYDRDNEMRGEVYVRGTTKIEHKTL